MFGSNTHANTQANTQANVKTQANTKRARSQSNGKVNDKRKTVVIPKKHGQLSSVVKDLSTRYPDYAISLVTDTDAVKVNYESILVELPGIAAMLMVVTEPDSIAKHSDGIKLIPSDTLDSYYYNCVKNVVTKNNVADIVTFITASTDVEERATELIIYVGEKYNEVKSPTLAVSDDCELVTTLSYDGETRHSPITATPLTTEFSSITSVLTKNTAYSRNTVASTSSEITGYFRPIPTNKEVMNPGTNTTSVSIRIETDVTINNISASSPSINDLLIGVTSLIASNRSYSSVWFSKLVDKRQEVTPLEILTTSEELTPLEVVQPHEAVERLKQIIAPEINISVDISLSTMPEIYDILAGLVTGDEKSYIKFADGFKETFGVVLPDNLPIVLSEKNEYPVGFIPANGVDVPITDITPTKIMGNGEVDLGLNIFANQISISTATNQTPLECWLSTITQMGFVGKIIENGLHITFAPEFLKFIISITSKMNIVVNGEVLEEPITNISTQSYLSKVSLDLGQLTAGLYTQSANGSVYPKPHVLYTTH